MLSIPLSPLAARSISASKELPIGTLGQTPDGRCYRYAQAGAADLAPGKLAVAATVVANHQNMAVAAAAAVGATSVTVTLGATAATADYYADGFLTINDAAGEGISYRVKSHPAHAGSGSLVVELYDPIKVALTTSSEASLDKNPWSAAVISVTDQADMPVGIPNVTITAAYYGWLQTKGVCSAFADESITAGLAVTTGTGVAGALEAIDGAGEPLVGVALVAGVDDEYRAVSLMID